MWQKYFSNTYTYMLIQHILELANYSSIYICVLEYLCARIIKKTPSYMYVERCAS